MQDALCRQRRVLPRSGETRICVQKQISGDTKRSNMEHTQPALPVFSSPCWCKIVAWWCGVSFPHSLLLRWILFMFLLLVSKLKLNPTKHAFFIFVQCFWLVAAMDVLVKILVDNKSYWPLLWCAWNSESVVISLSMVTFAFLKRPPYWLHSKFNTTVG